MSAVDLSEAVRIGARAAGTLPATASRYDIAKAAILASAPIVAEGVSSARGRVHRDASWISPLGLSTRARNVVLRVGISSLDELAQWTEFDFTGVQNCGPAIAREIAQAAGLRRPTS